MKSLGIPAVAMLWACLALTGPAPGQEAGRVQLPLEVYTKLLEAARPPRRAPAGYALGSARVSVAVADAEGRPMATIQVRLEVDVLEDEWVLIPVLAGGTAVQAVTVDGKAVQLLPTSQGLAWSTNTSGAATMHLVYRVDAIPSEAGYVLPVPVPEAAAITLTATLPGSGLDASIIPAAGTNTVSSGDTTTVSATIPTTRGVQISWRTPTKQGHSISRAIYRGQLVGDALVWSGELGVQLFGDDTVTLPLLPRNVTLTGLKVDGQDSVILVDDDRFATLVQGRGLHKVVVDFQVPVIRQDGRPHVELEIPQIPVSRFELTLPGKKELTVTPASNVTTEPGDQATLATVHVPMTPQVTFAWSEAVPEAIKAEVRSNATTYHLVHAEEGVLFVRAIVDYEISRGQTSVIDLVLPPDVQLNRIEADSGAVADWRIARPEGETPRIVSVFLDRQLEGRLRFDVLYDRSLSTDEPAAAIPVPLLWSVDAQRQRGMVALLASSDVALKPVEEIDATRVGENQLPAFVRDAVDQTVAHTYKYAEALPRLVVEASVPERVQGKFDALVDTLISLGDVTMTGSASVEINVKSGGIMELDLELPAGVNLLSLTAPSRRTHRANPDGERLGIHVEFTQEMDGHFRLDLTYERIMTERETAVDVPTLRVRGAEVAQGRIAVEALSAVEVETMAAEQLMVVDVSELPQQLVLRTTNPILMAYKYVHADPPPRLSLNVTRHRVLGVQEAAIDGADYRTLFTPDGLSVTTAHFVVRNSRKQFLRIRLPEGSEVWSASVNGKPEKPAVPGGEDGQSPRSVLIKIINSTQGFPVQLIYATPGPRIGRLGRISGTLPRPDILVTRSRWDLYVPDNIRYGDPSTNMNLTEARKRVTRGAMDAELGRLESAGAAQRAGEPLRITVPAAGVHFAFDKLYANQAREEAWFTLPYASRSGIVLGHLVNLVGTLALWAGVLMLGAGIGLAVGPVPRIPFPVAAGIAVAGLVLLVSGFGVFRLGATLPVVVSALIALGLVLANIRRSHAAGDSGGTPFIPPGDAA